MKEILVLPRRRFIKTFTFASACSTLLGETWKGIFAAEIQTLAAVTVGTLRVKLDDFPALLNESGSLRLAIVPLNGDMPNGQFYPVIINRGPNNMFHALNSRCTHQGCVVEPLDSSSNQMTCPCHGSVFAIDGRRLAGPASGTLARFAVKFDGQNRLEIQIPNLGYTVTGSNVQPTGGGTPRLRLDFRTFRNVEYEVHFRASLNDIPVPIAFSRTLDGPMEETGFLATTNAIRSLFVERTSPSGFYMVAVRTTEI